LRADGKRRGFCAPRVMDCPMTVLATIGAYYPLYEDIANAPSQGWLVQSFHHALALGVSL